MSIPIEIVKQIPSACRALEKSFRKRCPKLSSDKDSIWRLINNTKPSFVLKQKGKKEYSVFLYAVEQDKMRGTEKFSAACLAPCIFVTRECLKKDFSLFGMSYRTYVLLYVLHHEIFHMYDKRLSLKPCSKQEFDADWEAFQSVIFPMVKRNYPVLLESWASSRYPRSSTLFDPSSAVKRLLYDFQYRSVFVKRLKKMLNEHNF
jgi:hypothetical protein